MSTRDPIDKDSLTRSLWVGLGLSVLLAMGAVALLLGVRFSGLFRSGYGSVALAVSLAVLALAWLVLLVGFARLVGRFRRSVAGPRAEGKQGSPSAEAGSLASRGGDRPSGDGAQSP
ncbi:MAG: hypothetical protein HY686_00525 [Chloroflexi bacterium]|nr:hypothetical protein [Chloroflexota bacterium]